jgi:GntR family transcriptional regulator / MocR family aminotransferase
MRYQASLTIPITLTRQSGESLQEQIVLQVVSAVEQGLVAGDTRLPSTRNLAELLGVSRGVVAAAYDDLFTQGYLKTRARSGTYVAPPGGCNPPATVDPPAGAAAAAAPNGVVDLRPGQPNGEAFPLAAWRAAWRQASFRQPPTHEPPALGLPELRRAVAAHVSRTRGVSLAGKAVVITGGTAHGLRVVLDALGLRGPEVAMEEPVSPALHQAVRTEFDRPAALPVDADGACLDAVPDSCRAVVLTPDVQVPSGSVMSTERRRAAAAWAARADGHLIEVACDAVFRSRASRLPRVLHLGGDASVLLGGFCQVLTPALKLGYAIVPRDLATVIERRLAERAEQPPYVTQLAVAELLTNGTVVRVMHRLGTLWERKRRLVEAALSADTAGGPGDRSGGQVGGRDAADVRVVYLLDPLDADVAAGILRGRGVLVDTLASYYFSGRPARSGLVLGYGHQPDETLLRALPILREVLTG